MSAPRSELKACLRWVDMQNVPDAALQVNDRLPDAAWIGYSRQVDLSAFEESVTREAPPPGLSALLQALWHERHGDWSRAHEITQDITSRQAAWVHAYLHRREGDRSNAAYWYRQAAKPIMHGSLDEEWRSIVSALLNEEAPAAGVNRQTG